MVSVNNINEKGLCHMGEYSNGETYNIYTEHECMHHHKKEYRGALICERCGATYNESTLEWEKIIDE